MDAIMCNFDMQYEEFGRTKYYLCQLCFKVPIIYINIYLYNIESLIRVYDQNVLT